MDIPSKNSLGGFKDISAPVSILRGKAEAAIEAQGVEETEAGGAERGVEEEGKGEAADGCGGRGVEGKGEGEE